MKMALHACYLLNNEHTDRMNENDIHVLNNEHTDRMNENDMHVLNNEHRQNE